MPEKFLDIFFSLSSENDAIKFHNYMYEYLDYDFSKITALEYFG